MNIKTMRYIICLAVIGSCAQIAVNAGQALAQEEASADKEIHEIEKVWEKNLTGFVNRDIDSVIETMSPNYSTTIDGKEVGYSQYMPVIEKLNDDFFANHISCFIDSTKILGSEISGNRANIIFEYTLKAFNTEAMRWNNYQTTQEVFFAKEGTQWKIIGSGEKKNKWRLTGTEKAED